MTQGRQQAADLFTPLDDGVGRRRDDARCKSPGRGRPRKFSVVAEITRESTETLIPATCARREERRRERGRNETGLYFPRSPRERSPNKSSPARRESHDPKRMRERDRQRKREETKNGVGERRRKKQHRRSRSSCLARVPIYISFFRRTRPRERESARAGERSDRSREKRRGRGETGQDGWNGTRQGETGNNTFSRGDIYAARDIMAPDLPCIVTARLTYPESHCPVHV